MFNKLWSRSRSAALFGISPSPPSSKRHLSVPTDMTEGCRCLGQPCRSLPPQGVMWQPLSGIKLFPNAQDAAPTCTLSNAISVIQPIPRLRLVKYVTRAASVFMHGTLTATSTSTLWARLISPALTSSTFCKAGVPGLLRKTDGPAMRMASGL